MLNNVRWPGRRRANIDHVVIGPGGVFVIDSKHWSGTVSVAADVLRQHGRSREKEVAALPAAALAVTGVIGQVAAVPVLCFVRDEPIVGWARDVMVCSAANVTDMLTSRPPVLHAATIGRLLPILTRDLFAATSPAAASADGPSIRDPWRAASSRRGRGPARRRRGPRATRFACLVAAFVVAVAMVPTLATMLSNGASQGVQHLVAPSKPVGTTQTIPAADGHPELAMTVRSVVDTRVVGHGPKPPTGHRLVAVTMRLENRGDHRWSWDSNARLTLVDSAGTAYGPMADYHRVEADRVVRGSPVVPPVPTAVPPSGSSARAPPARALAHSTPWPPLSSRSRATYGSTPCHLDVGPGLPKTLRWTL